MCLSRFLMATHLNVLVNEYIFYAVRVFDMTFQMVFELVSFAAFFTLEGPRLIVTWHVDAQHIVCYTFVSAYVTLEWPLFWMDTPHVVFQMTTSYTWKNTQSALFWFFYDTLLHFWWFFRMPWSSVPSADIISFLLCSNAYLLRQFMSVFDKEKNPKKNSLCCKVSQDYWPKKSGL